MSLEILVLLLVSIVAIGFSPLGLGGGILFMPILLYILEWDIKLAILGSLVLVWSVATGSRIAHDKGGYGDFSQAKKGAIYAVPGAIVGTIIGYYLVEYVSSVAIKIAAFIIVTWVFYKTVKRVKSGQDLTGEAIGEMNESTWMIGTGLGGLSSGLLGIGGGAIFVTVNRTYGGFDTRGAAGTSFMLASILVPVAAIAHVIVDGTWPMLVSEIGYVGIILIPMWTGFLSFSGAKYAIKYLPVKVITMTFLLMVSLSLVKYIQDISVTLLG